eukprot:104362-Pelagomonas_calceolata.AAC.16
MEVSAPAIEATYIGEPPSCELLYTGHIHDAVVQVGDEVRHVLDEKHTVYVHRVSSQLGSVGLRHILLNEGQHLATERKHKHKLPQILWSSYSIARCRAAPGQNKA